MLFEDSQSYLLLGSYLVYFGIFFNDVSPYFPLAKLRNLVGKRNPNFLGQSLHALVQVAIVAAGASIGKEGAPRELGALFGGSLF